MFDWLASILDIFGSFFPRFVHIRTTHQGVKWPFCGQPKAMKPGLRFVWPLVDQYEIIVVARQTDTLPPQCLTIADGTTVAVKGLAIYSVEDIVLAYGTKNWDVTTTVQDLCMAAITEVVSKLEKSDLRDLAKINGRITRRVRSWLTEYGIRLEKCRLVEVSVARTLRLLGSENLH